MPISRPHLRALLVSLESICEITTIPHLNGIILWENSEIVCGRKWWFSYITSFDIRRGPCWSDGRPCRPGRRVPRFLLLFSFCRLGKPTNKRPFLKSSLTHSITMVEEVQVELPLQLSQLSDVLENQSHAFASGSKDIQQAALNATQYIFDLGMY